jgi:rubredoxin
MAEEETEKAVEAVDKYEDEEAAKRKKAADSYDEKSEKDVFICPKCKALVGEADFAEDEVSEAFTTGMASRIECTNCGYEGLPIEVSREEYEKFAKAAKK